MRGGGLRRSNKIHIKLIKKIQISLGVHAEKNKR
jgi:hypothetical protein